MNKFMNIAQTLTNTMKKIQTSSLLTMNETDRESKTMGTIRVQHDHIYLSPLQQNIVYDRIINFLKNCLNPPRKIKKGCNVLNGCLWLHTMQTSPLKC